jgi:ubiquinone/menaquinone biosynthesis C-methylase UbiE
MLNDLKNYFRTNKIALRQLRLAYGYLQDCNKVLDVGCGTGEFIKLNRKQIEGLESNRLTAAAARKKDLNVKLGRAEKLPFKDGTFDGIHCSHVIEHLPPEKVHAFLNEAGRVLTRGGVLVISTPTNWSGFYDKLTHLKPYPPRALLRYLVESAPDTSLPKLKHKVELVALHWRRHYLLQVTGYTLVVRKI